MVITAADARAGVAGQVSEGDVSVTFASRTVDGAVSSTILGAHDEVLVEYRERSGPPLVVRARGDAPIELERPPELRINGVLYGASTPDQVAALHALARSPEGALIRRLGLELVTAVPGSELTAERRGLEIPTQALWPHFPRDRADGPALTADYEINAAGYVVLTQPENLVLTLNRTRRVSREVRALHDDGQVGECLGRCGGGCTGGIDGVGNPYPSQWVDTIGEQFPYHQEVRCITGEDWVYTWYATPTTHSLAGYWTSGCQLHDNCCRGVAPLPCILSPTCDALVPLVLASFGLGEYRTWTYSDYTWSIDAYNAGYSGCTCPGVDKPQDYYECTEGG
jgi:hypothetical protein